MKTSSAVLVLASAVAAHAAVGYRQHREQLRFQLGVEHQRRMAEVEKSPESSPERVVDMRANRTLANLIMRFRLRAITLGELRVNLRDFASKPELLAYWNRHGFFRLAEAAEGDRRLRAAGLELLAAYGPPAVPEPDPVTVAA